ncbi:MAG: hypothetical protein V4633_07010 [Pseudomonadota bacterium]
MNTDNYRDPATGPAFDALRGAMAGLDAPRGVEKELMAAFAARHPQQRWYHALSPAQWGVGTTMAVAVLAFVLTVHAPVQDTRIAIPAAADRGDFIALDTLERIEQEPNPRMVETDVPRAALASLGLPVNPENAGDSVRAEMLIGSDGAPLALRLISIP